MCLWRKSKWNDQGQEKVKFYPFFYEQTDWKFDEVTAFNTHRDKRERESERKEKAAFEWDIEVWNVQCHSFFLFLQRRRTLAEF